MVSVPENGDAVVHIAAMSGDISSLRYLYESASNINAINFEGEISLILALKNSTIGVSEYLLTKGIKLSIVTKNSAAAYSVFESMLWSHLSIKIYYICNASLNTLQSPTVSLVLAAWTLICCMLP